MDKYIVATIKKWNIDEYYLSKFKKNKNWHIITNPKKCVCFHSTNLPFGRGGSPIQNLIIRNYKKTFITALKMINEIDAGPIYIKHPLKLDGNAQQIYEKSAKIIFKMIKIIIKSKLILSPQKGKIVKFKRRTFKQNAISIKTKSLKTLYNHIRMLDAESYPSAFINYGNFKIEFNNAKITKKKLDANVNIRFISKIK